MVVYKQKELQMNGLLKSRKFWLAVFGCITATVSHYLAIPEEIWQSIVALVMVLITGIAIEDFGGAGKE